MTKRICPKCKKPLGDHDSSFCTLCGSVLPKDLIKTDNVIRVRTYSPSEPEVSKRPFLKKLVGFLKNKTMWSVLSLIVFITFVLIGIVNSGVLELIGINIATEVAENGIEFPGASVFSESNRISFNLTVPEGEFAKKDLATHVPAEVDVYFEGSNLAAFLKKSPFELDEEDFGPKAMLLLEPEFAGFAYDVEGQNRWAFVFIPRDISLAEEVFAGMGKDYWKYGILDEYMLVTNGADVFDLVKSIDDGITRSLAQNPEYAKRLQELPNSGQFQILFMTEDAKGIVRNSLGGFTQETIGMINTILLSGFDSLVISNLSE